jgi:hypothetical protein
LFRSHSVQDDKLANGLRTNGSRRTELKTKWTVGLEQCRAQSLNATAVAGFFEVLDNAIEKYNIPEENIYNMDEKGLQLGIGKRVLALVDRNQHTVQKVQDGNKELVTVIETVCGWNRNPSFCRVQGRS